MARRPRPDSLGTLSSRPVQIPATMVESSADLGVWAHVVQVGTRFYVSVIVAENGVQRVAGSLESDPNVRPAAGSDEEQIAFDRYVREAGKLVDEQVAMRAARRRSEPTHEGPADPAPLNVAPGNRLG